MRTPPRPRSEKLASRLARVIVSSGVMLALATVARAQQPDDPTSTPRDSAAASVPSAAQARGGVSPGAAVLLGVAATAVPLGLAVYDDGDRLTWIGGLTGIIIGPGVGLAAGGRGDLALRGVLVRSAGLGLFLVGAAAFGASFENDLGDVGNATIILGAVAGAVTAGSMIWDLGITYGAVRDAREGRLSFGVRADGVVTVTAAW